ncbi:PAS domain-containing protein [Tardiphaga sp.]|jgi:PAS domain-containing protein|uniref:PAS domain-containing protein n=1 Tax=Tardiphaga sp. TaxID=1926292 RepID=UPI0037DA5877
MAKLISVASICESLAELAQANGCNTLSMWLKLATNQAYLDQLMTTAQADGRIGVWDWDVANNKNYTNDYAGSFFNVDAQLGARGHPIERIIECIHADDAAEFNGRLENSIRTGEQFHVEYRVKSADTIRWVRADGQCSLDDSGRPMRMLGSLVDITHEKPPENVIVMRRQLQRS